MNINRSNVPFILAKSRENAAVPYAACPVNTLSRAMSNVPEQLMELRVDPPLHYVPMQYNHLNYHGVYNNNLSIPPTNSYILPPNHASSNHLKNEPSRSNVLVFTNTNLSTVEQNQNLSSINLGDKVSFALPERASFEEVGAEPMDREDILNLLDFTLRKNENLKNKKKRLRTKKKQENVTQNQTQIKTMSNVSNVEPATTNQTEIEENPKELKENNAAAAKMTENYSISINNAKLSPKLKEILKLRNKKYDNPEIIESLKKFNILSPNSPYWKTPKVFTHLPPTSVQSVSYSLPADKTVFSSQISKETKNTPERPKNELELKSLMQESWQDIDDDKEDTNSKLIYKTLENLAISYGVNVDALKKLESGSPKTKKKKKKKKAQKLSEENEKEQKKNELDHDVEFEKLYDEEKVKEGLEIGNIFKAILRLNAKNCFEAFASTKQQEERDVFIEGKKNRNRALDGDLVAVELEPESKWKYCSDSTSEEQKIRQKCGKVVYIFEENAPRVVIGHIRYLYGTKLKGFVLFPSKKQYPLVKITNRLPTKWRSCEKIRENVLFSVKITSWTKVKIAEGHFLQDVGLEDDLDTHKKCFLLENGLEVKPFEPVDEYLPPLPYEISEEELSQRKDLRSCCVFSIDPPSARDLDDALSCTVLSNGNVQVGIHIADVTHFLTSDTPLDLDVRKKATSVYLVDTVFHMLPLKLCDLCSLTPDMDKLAFSVFVEVDENANVVSHSFYKSVIRSCAKLTYDHAQAVIDGQYDSTSFPPIVNGFSVSDCVDSILNLHSLAVKMRRRRFKEGALRLDQPKLTFKLDENGSPISFSLYKGRECNWLVEEFMLLANVLTAKKIKECFPQTALLRFHPSPNEKSLSAVVENLEKAGIRIDMTSAGTIYRSMKQYDNSDEIGAARMAVITNLLVKPMLRACYTCSVPNIENCSDFYHYALNEPFYTHFTSPIRRYADVIVHRLLAAAIGYSENPNLKPDDVQDIAMTCNKKKNNAKKVSECSTEVYLKTFLELNGPLQTRAVVTDVKKSHIEVLDLTTYCVCRIHLKKIGGKTEFKEDTIPSLEIEWNVNKNTKCVQLVQIFTIVDAKLSCVRKNKNSENEMMMELLPILS